MWMRWTCKTCTPIINVVKLHIKTQNDWISESLFVIYLFLNSADCWGGWTHFIVFLRCAGLLFSLNSQTKARTKRHDVNSERGKKKKNRIQMEHCQVWCRGRFSCNVSPYCLTSLFLSLRAVHVFMLRMFKTEPNKRGGRNQFIIWA